MKTIEIINQQTMSSREIAQITGKQHAHVMEAIRNMEPAWEKVSQSKFRLAEYIDEQGKKRPEYQLNKLECLYVSTKFSDEARAKLVMRWYELEIAQQQRIKNTLTIAEGIEMQIIPSDKHVFLVTSNELARAIQVSESTLRSSKHNHKAFFEADVHYIDDFIVKDSNTNLEYRCTVWTKKGVIQHAKFLRTGFAKQLRDWAEAELTGVVKNNEKALPVVRNHNRLTSDRLLDIMGDVCLIADHELRTRIANKIMG